MHWQVMGKKLVRDLFISYAEAMLRPVLDHMESNGCSDETLHEVKGHAIVIAQAVAGTGIQPLMTKWLGIDWVSFFLETPNDGGVGILDILNETLDPQDIAVVFHQDDEGLGF